MKKVKYPAPFIIHWPSRSIECCKEHADGLISLSKIISVDITITKNTNRKTECEDCIIENQSNDNKNND